MRTRTVAILGMAMAAGALSACSKPAADTAAEAQATTANAAAAGADATANAGAMAADGAMAAGGAVSPPNSPQNDAVNADGNATETTQTAGSNSFTEGQAKGHLENAGYTEVTGLAKTPDGLWTGSAKKGGKTMTVSVDFKGAISAK